jgi:hypothetical protein
MGCGILWIVAVVLLDEVKIAIADSHLALPVSDFFGLRFLADSF